MKNILAILLAFTAFTVCTYNNTAVAKIIDQKLTCEELHQENDRLKAFISDVKSKKSIKPRKYGIKRLKHGL